MSSYRSRIVILGGGFAGAYCAQALERTLRGLNAEVLLIDRHNYFVFSPLLIEAGTGSLEPRHAVVPMRAFLRTADFRMAEVCGISPDEKVVMYQLPESDASIRNRMEFLLDCSIYRLWRLDNTIPGNCSE